MRRRRLMSSVVVRRSDRMFAGTVPNTDGLLASGRDGTKRHERRCDAASGIHRHAGCPVCPMAS